MDNKNPLSTLYHPINMALVRIPEALQKILIILHVWSQRTLSVYDKSTTEIQKDEVVRCRYYKYQLQDL